jgi:hypothetical protein
MTTPEEQLESLKGAHQALRERATLERGLFAEAVNRFNEGDLSVARIVDENARLVRESSDARYDRDLAEQRAAALQARLDEATEENRRHRLVLGTRIVSLALRVQRWIAALKGR